MENLGGFVLEVIFSGAISGVILLIAGFLGRSQISHFLNKDLEKVKSKFQNELEASKSKYQIELENYKASLIAETEKTKASQSVKTSVALKFSEHQFNAVNSINLAYADLGNQATCIYRMYLDQSYLNPVWQISTKEQQEEFQRRSKALTSAIFSASLFMKETDVEELHEYCGFLSGVVQAGVVERLHISGVPAEFPNTTQITTFIKLKTIADKLEMVRVHEKRTTEILRSYADKFLNMQSSI